MAQEPIIKIRGLRKSFGDKHVLQGLDLDVREGESLVVIGGSGTGKSVLIKNIIGLLTPDDGEIIVEGTSLKNLSEKEWNTVRRKFGMLFQGAALFDSMSVYENVAFPLVEHTDKGKDEIRRIVRENLELVDLSRISDKFPAELSGGMKKRVGLARALAMSPRIMLYDEPTTGLDPITGDTINRLIVKLRDRLGMSSITITHDMVSAFRIADRIAMLYKGRIIQAAPPEEIVDSEIEVVHDFVRDRSPLQISRVSY